MADELEKQTVGALVGNLGEPVHLSEVKINGISGNYAREGELVNLITRLAVTSDESIFHRIADGLSGVIQHSAVQDGKVVNLRRADFVVLVIKPNNSAKLWMDTAAVSISAIMNRSITSGAVVFENDIVDVTGMDFPLVNIESADRVVCLFRQDWGFGLYFDFNPDESFDRPVMISSLGRLHRTLRYRHIYEIVGEDASYRRLVLKGWFPFAEIITSEFIELARANEAGVDLNNIEQRLEKNFNKERLERMFTRWMTKPHFEAKRDILRSAVNSYIAGEWVASIKIVLTEIEGILNSAHKAVHGRGAKIKKLLAFAIHMAEQKTGAPDTLLFSAAFADYLNSHTFANFDPEGPLGNANSRHAVGHGAAESDSYTAARALQALLTLDQIGFYT